jgi:acyl-coenzyme A thioesterase PaaI-like protein
MQFDLIPIAEILEAASPSLANSLSMRALGLISPFNAHLKAKLLLWGKNKSKIEIKCHRGIRNHVGSIHAGALFTLGETCAGIIIIRNFSFKNFRPLMSDVKVKYSKQARGKVFGTSHLAPGALKKAQKELKEKKIPFIPMETIITDEKNNVIAEVKTIWQVKPWKQVRKGSS